jgi:hypothetical protein
MGLRETGKSFERNPPVVPPELLDRLGPPEDIFGPNLRFRTWSTLLGSFLTVLGFAFFVLGLAGPPASRVLSLLGGGLMAVGVAAVVLPRRVPPTWIYVCSRGIARARGDDWSFANWDEVIKVEDVSISKGAVTVRQFRLVLAGRDDWGFIADCRRLAEVLHRKIAERDDPKDPIRAATVDPKPGNTSD